MTIILSHAETTKNTKGFPNKKVKKNKRTDVFSELNCTVMYKQTDAVIVINSSCWKNSTILLGLYRRTCTRNSGL